jgi:hypothetical protein
VVVVVDCETVETMLRRRLLGVVVVDCETVETMLRRRLLLEVVVVDCGVVCDCGT